MIQLNDYEFQTIVNHIREKYGVSLEKKRYLIESRLWLELARYKADSYTEYWQKMRADHTGVMEGRMMDLLTTNYTYFCREEQHFSFIQTKILPNLGKTTFRIWCAGCATGQECYTLAMYLSDCREKGILHTPFRIFGTDLSGSAIAAAEKGEYSGADYTRLSAQWQEKYCEPFAEGRFKVRRTIKQMIEFQRQNLLEPSVFEEKYDLIFCRNVMIYFEEKERKLLLERLMRELKTGGYLFIGHTESLIGFENGLIYIQPSVYRKPGGT